MHEMLIELAKQAGVAGTILALCMIYIWRLSQDMQKIQDKRVADAQAMVDKLLELNAKWNETLRALVEKDTEANKALNEVRGMVSDLYLEAKR